MSNYKIRVANEAESKEAQELFFELGAKPRNIIEDWKNEDYGVAWFALGASGNLYNEIVFRDNDSGISCSPMYKEITLPQLRDLVVLKRNDVCDATHDCGKRYERFGYLTSDGVEYIWSWGNSSWFKPKEMNFKSLNIKPIEKKMKEYLTKMQDGSYKLIPSKMGDDDIEVPEGANVYAEPKDGIRTFWSNDYQWFDGCVVRDIELEDSEYTFNEWAIDWDAKILWQRYNQPEELPFIDNEPSINDQYAEIEKVRQATTETEYLMQGKNGEKLMESIKELKNTSAWSVQVGGDHYKQFKIQPMQFALENKLDAAQQNVIKYIMRHSFKNGKQDLEKAKHYIDLMIEFYYGEK